MISINKSLKYFLILAVSVAFIDPMHAMSSSYKLIKPALGAAGISVPLYALTKIKERYELNDHKKQAITPEAKAIDLFLASFAAGAVASGLSLSAVPPLIALGAISAGIYGVDKLLPEYKVADTLVRYAGQGITKLKNVDFNIPDYKPEITVITDTLKPIQDIRESMSQAKPEIATVGVAPASKFSVDTPGNKSLIEAMLKVQKPSHVVNITAPITQPEPFADINIADPANKNLLQNMLTAQKHGQSLVIKNNLRQALNDDQLSQNLFNKLMQAPRIGQTVKTAPKESEKLPIQYSNSDSANGSEKNKLNKWVIPSVSSVAGALLPLLIL